MQNVVGDDDDAEQPAEQQEQATAGLADVLLDELSERLAVVLHRSVQSTKVVDGAKEDAADEAPHAELVHEPFGGLGEGVFEEIRKHTRHGQQQQQADGELHPEDLAHGRGFLCGGFGGKVGRLVHDEVIGEWVSPGDVFFELGASGVTSGASRRREERQRVGLSYFG